MRLNNWHGRLGTRGHEPWSEGTQRRFLVRPLSWVAMGLLVVMMLAGFAGCGESSQNGTVNLTYALWDPNEEIGYKQSAAQFMQQHPNIHVTIELTPWGQYWQ